MTTKVSDNMLETPPGGGGGVKGTLIDSGSTSGASFLHLTTGIDNTSQHYRLFLYHFIGGVTGDLLGLRMSNNGGSSWRSGGTDYSWSVREHIDATETIHGGAFLDMIKLNENAINAPGTFGRSHNWIIDVFQPGVANAQTVIKFEGVISRAGSTKHVLVAGGGAVRTAEVNDAIQILETAGPDFFECDYELWRL